jgi:hypothetical protein
MPAGAICKTTCCGRRRPPAALLQSTG